MSQPPLPSTTSPPVPEPPALDRRLAELEGTVARLEARLAALEAGAPRPRARPVEEAPEPEVSLLPLAPMELMGLVGRVCLILAGAFLIRAFSDAGRLPLPAGVALGLGYGLLWTVQADRAGRAGRRTAAAFHAVTTALIAFPLLLEATVKFHVLSPGLAAVALLGVTLLLAGVCWRRDLHGVFWASVLAALATGFGLMLATAALEAFSAVFIALGGASLWLTYGRRWHGIRWPVALVADLSVFALTSLAAWSGGPPEAYRHLSAPRAILLGLALVAVYLGSLAVRILQRHRAVNPFEAVQAALVLLVGFGGALRVAHASGSGELALGILAFAGGAGCYVLAFAFVERQVETGANFTFFSSVALVFVLAGCLIVLPGTARVLGLVLLGLLSVGVALRFRRSILFTHGTAALATAALASGLLVDSLAVFFRPGQVSGSFGAAALLVLGALAGAHAAGIGARGPEEARWTVRLPSFVLAALALAGLSALAMAVLTRLVAGDPPEPAAMAVTRTAVLTAAALLLAGLGRVAPGSEAAWLVYPVLGLAGLKLLVEDFAKGRPLTLFLALGLLGVALVLAPRLLRARRAPVEGPPA
ncbi:MAG: hypothetical protein U0P81_11095 [Holophagaceae bacterium]